MRVGLMIGTDKERDRAGRLPGFVDDIVSVERAGFASAWIPQVPGYLDALTMITVASAATSSIELATAVLPIQTRHPIAMAQQALTTQIACEGRLTLGLGPSHHWIIGGQLGLPYDKPASLTRDYLAVLRASFAGPGPVDLENATFRIHSPVDVTDEHTVPMLLAALAPVMLRLAGEQTAGTILWMADERAIETHVRPRITEAARAVGRPSPRIVAGVPVTLCADGEVNAVRERAKTVLGHAGYSPNYERLLEHGDAKDIDDIMAIGSASSIEARLRRFRDVGVTDLSARIVPFGDTPEDRLASKQRTQDALAAMIPELS